MWSFFKKLISALVVLYLVALVLNLKVGGTPTREWTSDIWQSKSVQKVYTTVRDRFLALIRKDISVEDVFKSDMPSSDQKNGTQGTATNPNQEEFRTIDMEKLDEKDRQALEKILNKSSK